MWRSGAAGGASYLGFLRYLRKEQNRAVVKTVDENGQFTYQLVRLRCNAMSLKD